MRTFGYADKLLTHFAVCRGPEALTASIQPIAIVSCQVITPLGPPRRARSPVHVGFRAQRHSLGLLRVLTAVPPK
jgi:hypothetical protein